MVIIQKEANVVFVLGVNDFQPDTFEEAKREMFYLMEDNYFGRFVKYLRGEESKYDWFALNRPNR